MVAPKTGVPSQRNTQMSAMTIVIIAVAVVVVVVILVAALLVPAVLSNTQIGSGHLVTQQENYAGFTAVSLGYGFRFTIVQSSTYSVNLTIDDNLVNYVRFSQSGNTLSVGLAPGHLYPSTSAQVRITMPDLTRLDISGGSSGTAVGFTSSHDFAATASGGSSMTIRGAARNISIDGSGGSRLDLSGFKVTNAQVNLSGGSGATVDLNGTLDATLSGGSNLSYIGNPTLGNINTSGFSTITKK